jgi:hypothetical protein
VALLFAQPVPLGLAVSDGDDLCCLHDGSFI